MRVITKILNTDGKTYRAGEPLDLSDSEARALIAEGKAFAVPGVYATKEVFEVKSTVDIEEVEEDGEDTI